jgi:hypothetical protein
VVTLNKEEQEGHIFLTTRHPSFMVQGLAMEGCPSRTEWLGKLSNLSTMHKKRLDALM